LRSHLATTVACQRRAICHPVNAVSLPLDDVRELVGEQPSSRRIARRPCTGAKRDVVAVRPRRGTEIACAAVRVATGMDADAREIGGKARLEEGALGCRKWLTTTRADRRCRRYRDGVGAGPA